MRGTLSPGLKLSAPQTICLSPLPSLTRQSESLSALGCLSRVTTWATTIPSNSPPIFSTPSTSMPIIVRRSASSSGGQSKSTYCLSQLSVIFILELPQKAQIVFVKQPDVVDPIPDHRNPLDAEAEGPASPYLRIVAHVLEDLGMHHATAGDFQPFLAHLARERATEINFKARLGIAEIMRAEPDACFRAHKFREHKLHRPLEISSRHAAVHVQPFDLLKRRVMGSVGVVAPINPTFQQVEGLRGPRRD